MNSLAQLESRYQATVDEVNAIRETHGGEVPAEAMAQLREAKNRMVEAHDAYSRAWEQAVASAPIELNLDSVTGRITVYQSAGEVGSTAAGGRFRWLMPRDAGYADALAEIERRQAIDARVAEVAYRAWGWRGPVRIDYYGASAVVTDGGRRLIVQLADLVPPAPFAGER